MDDVTVITLISCAALAVLVYMMWRSATAQAWADLTQNEKKKWRLDEEKRKESKK